MNNPLLFPCLVYIVIWMFFSVLVMFLLKKNGADPSETWINAFVVSGLMAVWPLTAPMFLFAGIWTLRDTNKRTRRRDQEDNFKFRYQ